jgi:hypothetical protein
VRGEHLVKKLQLLHQSQATLHFMWIAALSFLATGCMTDPTFWRYEADSYPAASESLVRKRLVVLPFKDSRSDANVAASVQLLLIPLVPYVRTDLSLPEAGGWSIGTSSEAWKFRPREDLARGAAEELRASGIFKEVILSRYPSEEDVVLYGEVKSTRYRYSGTAFGLSFIGGFLLALGLPGEIVTNELAIEFHLDDRVTGEVLWRKNYSDSYEKTFGIYNPPRLFNYDTMYKKMLRDAVRDLENYFSE